MNAQLKYADRRRSRCAVIQGSNERNAPGGPQVTIRDLKLGAELATSDQGPRRLSRAAPARPIRCSLRPTSSKRVREVLARR